MVLFVSVFINKSQFVMACEESSIIMQSNRQEIYKLLVVLFSIHSIHGGIIDTNISEGVGVNLRVHHIHIYENKCGCQL